MTKLDGIGVGRIRTVQFSSDSAHDSVAYGQMKTQVEVEGTTNHNAS